MVRRGGFLKTRQQIEEKTVRQQLQNEGKVATLKEINECRTKNS